jgi:hypothetical protein
MATWPPKPIDIALAHHKEMQAMVVKLRDNSNCIGQLLVGRTVRRKGEGRSFLVTEARLGIGGVTGIYGREPKSKARRPVRIGDVTQIEVVEP